MTIKTAYTADEWDLLVCLPRWVVGAASAAQHDNAQKTHAEIEAGFIAVAEGREMGSELVRETAQACMGLFDTNAAGAAAAGVTFSDSEEDLGIVLERIRRAAQLLRAKASADDAAIYKRWLVAITDMVIKAARSGDRLGMGGDLISPAEKRFRDQVVLAIQA